MKEMLRMAYDASDLIKDSMRQIGHYVRDSQASKPAEVGRRAVNRMQIFRIRRVTNSILNMYKRNVPRPMLDWWFGYRRDEPKYNEIMDWYDKHQEMERKIHIRPEIKFVLRWLTLLAFLLLIGLSFII